MGVRRNNGEGSYLRRKVEVSVVLESSGAEQSSVVSYFSEYERIRSTGGFSAIISALGGSNIEQVQHCLHFPRVASIFKTGTYTWLLEEQTTGVWLTRNSSRSHLEPNT